MPCALSDSSGSVGNKRVFSALKKNDKPVPTISEWRLLHKEARDEQSELTESDLAELGVDTPETDPCKVDDTDVVVFSMLFGLTCWALQPGSDLGVFMFMPESTQAGALATLTSIGATSVVAVLLFNCATAHQARSRISNLMEMCPFDILDSTSIGATSVVAVLLFNCATAHQARSRISNLMEMCPFDILDSRSSPKVVTHPCCFSENGDMTLKGMSAMMHFVSTNDLTRF
eukprot:s2_g60.t1